MFESNGYSAAVGYGIHGPGTFYLDVSWGLIKKTGSFRSTLTHYMLIGNGGKKMQNYDGGDSDSWLAIFIAIGFNLFVLYLFLN
jgi:hypothetical protein